MNDAASISRLVPPFDWQHVFVEPWTTDFPSKGWIFLMGFLVTTACGLVGKYLLLRRMALMGDAVSHSVLPGLAGAFLVASFVFGREGHAAQNSWVMFVGALSAGLLTAFLIEVLHRYSRIKQDAAIGIVFSTLFAAGVVLITLFADHVDLDADCVLYGEIGFVPFQDSVIWRGHELAPVPVVRMGIVATLTALAVTLFYKELLVSSFDPGLATSLGIRAAVVHFLLMGWLSVVVVSAFESVGAILVVAMLILPGATASLVSTRLPRIFLLIVAQAAASAVGGLHLALWLDCSIAGAMVVVACGLFAVAWAASALTAWRASRWSGLPDPGFEVSDLKDRP